MPLSVPHLCSIRLFFFDPFVWDRGNKCTVVIMAILKLKLCNKYITTKCILGVIEFKTQHNGPGNTATVWLAYTGMSHDKKCILFSGTGYFFYDNCLISYSSKYWPVNLPDEYRSQFIYCTFLHPPSADLPITSTCVAHNFPYSDKIFVGVWISIGVLMWLS